MSEKIGAAIIGTSHAHAVGHLNVLQESEHYEVISAAEPNEERLERARRDPRWEGVRWVSVEEVLDDDRVQMVCIETDPLESLAYARRCVAADKHTKIDKPPGIDYHALAAIYAEAQRRHRIVQMGYVYRYNPAFRLAYRAIREGWLGPIRSAVCQMNDRLTPEGRRRLDRYPGGQMYEICGHMIDVLLWLMGEPKRVSPMLRHSDPDNDELEDDVLAIFEFDEAVGVVKSHTRNGDRYFYLFGNDGSIQIDSPDRPKVHLTLSASHGDYPAGRLKIDVGPSPRYLPDLDDLAIAIRERRGVEHFTPEHDLAVHRALLMASGAEPR